MQTIVFIQDHQENKLGDSLIVSNNVAHGLIDSGFAKLYNSEFAIENDKMMRPTLSNNNKKNKYKTKIN